MSYMDPITPLLKLSFVAGMLAVGTCIVVPYGISRSSRYLNSFRYYSHEQLCFSKKAIELHNEKIKSVTQNISTAIEQKDSEKFTTSISQLKSMGYEPATIENGRGLPLASILEQLDAKSKTINLSDSNVKTDHLAVYTQMLKKLSEVSKTEQATDMGNSKSNSLRM